MDPITKIRKYDKNYHNQYYHEKRKFKMNKDIKDYNKVINNFYTLSEIEKHIDDYCEMQLLKEFDVDMNIEYDIGTIKELYFNN
jgi:hypothetical protein